MTGWILLGLLAFAGTGCGVKLDPLPPLRPTPEDADRPPRPRPSAPVPAPAPAPGDS